MSGLFAGRGGPGLGDLSGQPAAGPRACVRVRSAASRRGRVAGPARRRRQASPPYRRCVIKAPVGTHA